MSAKNISSDRRRSRPVTKHSPTYKLKRNKPALFLVILIIFMLVFSSFYVIFNSLTGSDDTSDNEVTYDTQYPVAEINTSKGLIAVELYTDEMPITCQNFIDLANDGFYDGMIFHRVMDDFMIQAGKSYPDGSTSTSPYGNIVYEDSDVSHVDGAISMASTGERVGGSAEFFICDESQTGLDGSYAAFGKTIQGIEVVRNIANEPHDGSFGEVGGGRPVEGDIIINSITIVNE
jgi:cyclophilin family peptidyl-prolyl cis-trans isomerase